MDFQSTGYFDSCTWRNHGIWATEDSQVNTITHQMHVLIIWENHTTQLYNWANGPENL